VSSQSRASALAAYFERLTPASLADLGRFYGPDAHFVDPFNDVFGTVAIEKIFAHMFEQLDAPRFEVRSVFAQGDEAVLVWVMHWGLAGEGGRIEGTSHVRFDAGGRVVEHRDYWDPTTPIYASIPVLGAVLRRIKRCISTQ